MSISETSIPRHKESNKNHSSKLKRDVWTTCNTRSQKKGSLENLNQTKENGWFVNNEKKEIEKRTDVRNRKMYDTKQ